MGIGMGVINLALWQMIRDYMHSYQQQENMMMNDNTLEDLSMDDLDDQIETDAYFLDDDRGQEDPWGEPLTKEEATDQLLMAVDNFLALGTFKEMMQLIVNV